MCEFLYLYNKLLLIQYYSLTQTSASYSPIAYFTNDCLAAPANLQSLCIEHSSTDTLQYYNDAGIESNAIRITFESQMQISGDRFYSHAIEVIYKIQSVS